MPRPFRLLSLPEFQHLVAAFPWTRRVTEVHMHHTWRPAHADYHGLSTIEGMWRFHTETQGWSDIAQHLSIGPAGELWTGRGWNNAPASATGHNGNNREGPFMFEIIGDFDQGRDPFEADQRAAVVDVIVALLEKFQLPTDRLRFHRDLGSPKTCPGTSIDYDEFRDEVEARRAARAADASRGLKAAKGKKARGAKARALPLGDASTATVAEALAALGEVLPHLDEEADAAVDCCAASPAGGDRDFFGPAWTDEQRSLLERHVVNLRNGQFIPSGSFSSSEDQVRRIFDTLLPTALEDARRKGGKLRVMFWAHGGLVDEASALNHVLYHAPRWRKAGIYPVYFVWETGLMNSLRDLILGRPEAQRDRGFLGDLGEAVTEETDAILENSLFRLATPVWSEMKQYAARAAAPGGGARFTAERLAEFARLAGDDAWFWGVGHSAGSILHSHFLPCVQEVGGPVIRDLFLLAPAITVREFAARLAPISGPGSAIAHTTMFTMNRATERDDNVITVYRKSLLYFVSRACEPNRPVPILGLEDSLRADPSMRAFFGMDAGPMGARGEIVWSPTGGHAGLSATNSHSHGGFDNDGDTLNSVARRITGDAALKPFPEGGVTPDEARALASAARGRRLALCVGIDNYPAPNALRGCVNDMQSWQGALQSLQFKVTTLTDSAATYAGVLGALRGMISQARAGDTLVFQFAGHGTEVTDENGDEAKARAGDLFDEALVPFDYEAGRFIIDDELGEIFDRIPAGVRFSCFMDCCHSGSNTRAIAFGHAPLPAASDERVRFLPVTPEVMERHREFRGKIGNPPPGEAVSNAGRSEVSFAACLDDQTAKEADGHGYFTRTACALLVASAGKLTNAQFMEAVIKGFPLPSNSQLPLLSCANAQRNEPLLGPPPGPANRDDLSAPAEPADAVPAPVPGQPAAAASSALAAGAINRQDVIETLRDMACVLRRIV